MRKVKQQFYEKAYPKGEKRINLKGLMGKFYQIFKKFETYREDVVYSLLSTGENFLDIGCGEGNLVFKALFKFNHCYGLDIARTRLKLAKDKVGRLSFFDRSRVKFLIGDADDRLPFSSKSIDAVTMVATLEHFFDPYQVIDEVKRVLKNKGQLIIQVPNLGFLPRRLVVLAGKLPVTSEDKTGWDGGHLHYFTESSLRKLLEEKNFQIEKVTCSGVFSNFRHWWVSLLGADIIVSARI